MKIKVRWSAYLILTNVLALTISCRASFSDLHIGCSNNLDCSLNGVCNITTNECNCDIPWCGPRCGLLQFAPSSPASGRDLYPASDIAHNTWNGPMIGPVNGTYHMYLPLYPAGLLYHPTALIHGTAPNRYGPWKWDNISLPGVEVSINPGALVYEEGPDHISHYTLWMSKPDGKTVGAIYHAISAYGPFQIISGSNASGCDINPSPLFVDGHFYCTGQKGSVIRTAPHLGGPWMNYSQITNHYGEDPFLWLDVRSNWHILYHAANGSQLSHCAESRVAYHIYSNDKGITWQGLENPEVEPYKPEVVWEEVGHTGNAITRQAYASMERPHLYMDPQSGNPTHLGVAAPLNIGDEGCANATKQCKSRHGNPCPCCNCKYASHAGTLLVKLQSTHTKL